MVMSDRIAVLNNGRIAQIGSPQAIYETPADVFVARFMGHENLLPIEAQDASGIQTPIGRIEGVFAPGSHLLLRPESLTLHQTRPRSSSAGFDVLVQESLYRGGVTEYRLDCQGWPLVAMIANQGESALPSGERLWLEIALSAAAVLNDLGDG